MTGAELRVLYRGDLASCNYSCPYCPFAKRNDSVEVTERDRKSLLRFADWCGATHFRLRILFTPWGEALVRKHYRDAFVRISHFTNVVELGIQTNLSRDPAWLADASTDAVRLWCTYHPSQVSRTRFLRRLEHLLRMRIRFSVGMVALREDFAEVRQMHQLLGQLERSSGQSIYFWLNAYDERTPGYYSPQDVDILTAIDPHFSFNLLPTPSLGARCHAGLGAISVDARGDARPCHFVQRPLGNLYDGSFEARLACTPCPNARCDCYIGYALREDLPFEAPLTRAYAPAAQALRAR